MKTKYALPVAQMVVAAALLWWNNFLFFAALRECDMAGPTPAFQLVVAINAPLALLRVVWDRYLPYRWDMPILIVAVGLFWYWVALNGHTWQQQRMVRTFSWRPARIIADTLLVVSGILVGLFGLISDDEAARDARFNVRGMSCFGPNVWFELLPSITCACLYIGWALVLIILFARDLLQCTLRKTHLSAVPSKEIG